MPMTGPCAASHAPFPPGPQPASRMRKPPPSHGPSRTCISARVLRYHQCSSSAAATRAYSSTSTAGDATARLRRADHHLFHVGEDPDEPWNVEELAFVRGDDGCPVGFGDHCPELARRREPLDRGAVEVGTAAFVVAGQSMVLLVADEVARDRRRVAVQRPVDVAPLTVELVYAELRVPLDETDELCHRARALLGPGDEDLFGLGEQPDQA